MKRYFDRDDDPTCPTFWAAPPPERRVLEHLERLIWMAVARAVPADRLGDRICRHFGHAGPSGGRAGSLTMEQQAYVRPILEQLELAVARDIPAEVLAAICGEAIRIGEIIASNQAKAYRIGFAAGLELRHSGMH